MSKKEVLAELAVRMEADKSLPLRESNFVFGEGSPDSKVMFIGEAPGFYEDREKRPFVGRAGQLLRKLIGDLNWKEEEVYITNIVKRRPPDNRDPLPEEIEAYKPYLAEQIRIVDPKVIVSLGRFSMNYFLPDAKISKDQGRLFRTGGKLVYPIYHPAAALRSTKVLEDLVASFKKLPLILDGKNLVETNPETNVELKRPPQRRLF
ncbi:MAG: uracil-DNA glycosylase [bacterium]|nr:uracil-DNA glycosylase [bacterium]